MMSDQGLNQIQDLEDARPNQQMLGSSGTIVPPSKVYVVVRVKIGPLPRNTSLTHYLCDARCLGEISGLPPPLSPFAL